MDSELPRDTTSSSGGNHETPLSSCIRYLHLDFYGCRYDASLDDKVRQGLLNDGVDPVIRGQVTPAAGASLVADIILSVASDIAAGLIVKSAKAVLAKVRKATSAEAASECSLGRTTIETDACDYVVTATPAAGVFAEDIDFNSLISKMMEFRKVEAKSGNSINRIETPCELIAGEDGCTISSNGNGSFSLWLVTYRDGCRWPSCLYDAVNDAFIPLGDRQVVEHALNERNEFYHPEG